jgi:hypothetical protein
MTQQVEQNELFDLAFRFVNETQESIFLTGKAGTGKTTFLKHLKKECSKNSIIAAPTGVAAIHAGGVTLHSLFQLPLHPFLPSNGNRSELLKTIRYSKQRLSLLRKMELLVIDEISMVRADVMDAIDTILKSVRRHHESPFGGVQMLYIGDLYQLPPVVKREEWELLRTYYESPFFFDSLSVKEQQPLLIELQKIYRQKEDEFVSLLNNVRNNQMSADDFQTLNSRYRPNFEPDKKDSYITLTTHNQQADRINERQLQKLDTTSFEYQAEIEGDFPENLYPAEANLILKEGAQVMFLKNDSNAQKYFNGKIGTIKKLETDKVVVVCDKYEIEVTKDVWENTRYTLNRNDEKLEQEVLGSFHQYPLRLAWAITIHKSQGLTFEQVMLDAAASFSSGQVYVALSRCTRLDGIVLLTPIPPTAIHTNTQVREAQSALQPRGPLLDRFTGARQVFTLQLLADLFEMKPVSFIAKELQKQGTLHAAHLHSNANSWLEQWNDDFLQLQLPAQKFIVQIQILLREIPIIEENPTLQQRIRDGASYFLPRIVELKTRLEQHPFTTEHKESAVALNEPLKDLLLALHQTIYLLEFATNVFSVSGYLKHKLNYATPRLNITSYAAHKTQNEDPEIKNPELFYQLKSWRDRLCNDLNVPIYMIANAASLKEICTYLPTTKQQLQQLNGFGKAKAEKYGDDILGLVETYCNEQGIETSTDLFLGKKTKTEKPSKTGKQPKIASAEKSLELFKEGKSIQAIATERNLTSGTVENHLMEYLATNEVPVHLFVTAQKLEALQEVFVSHPGKKHSELKQILGDDYSYTEIKAAWLYLNPNKEQADTTRLDK